VGEGEADSDGDGDASASAFFLAVVFGEAVGEASAVVFFLAVVFLAVVSCVVVAGAGAAVSCLCAQEAAKASPITAVNKDKTVVFI
jgi:hypothetical protein